MSEADKLLSQLDRYLKERKQQTRMSFSEYLQLLGSDPEKFMRDIFQLIHDMIHYYVPPGTEEFPDEPESVHYKSYDFTRLFMQNSESPYFADRPFGNRFMSLIESFNQVADRNRIYIFEGPPGSGKSTFLKNFLLRFENYVKTDEGEVYETSWHINKELVPEQRRPENDIILNCPNHDHPLLQIPVEYRKELLYELIKDREFRERLFNENKYSWVFKDEPCTICSSLFRSLLELTGSPLDVMNMIVPKRMIYDRRLGQGISVFNPGDIVSRAPIRNEEIQNALNKLFGDSTLVKVVHSDYAMTNNGIYVVMDIKQHNKNRLLDLHGIVSDGIHKVGLIEENITSMYVGLINPQDKEFIAKNQALKDRITTIKMPYVLDYKTEVQIYFNLSGKKVKEHFLPQIIESFARIIIASRLSKESAVLKEWIGDIDQYKRYCDPGLLLLKMSIYSGIIPEWISDEHRRKFKASIRKRILAEAEEEGFKGITGRESLRLFHDFYVYNSDSDKMINMQMLQDFVEKTPLLKKQVPEEFLKSLVDSYDYTILQQVKESLYFYNRNIITKDIQNYIFAMNFDLGSVEKNIYTGQKIEVTEEFLSGMEEYLLTGNPSDEERAAFRREIQQRYISSTITEIKVGKKKLSQTVLYKELMEIYKRNLKANALDPFKENDNFRTAIKEYNTKDFQSHDKKIRKDVTFLINRLMTRYHYTEIGAKDVCIYVIDKNIAGKFD